MHLAAVGANEIRHVLHQRQHRHLHHASHLDRFLDDHTHKILRRADYNYPVQRQPLHDRQRNIAGSWRQVYEHIIHIIPHDLAPELRNDTRNNGAAPKHRFLGGIQQKIHTDHLYPAWGSDRQHMISRGAHTLRYAERFRDRRPRKVGVKYRGAETTALGLRGEQARHHGFAHAALSAYNRDHLLDRRAWH